MWWYTPDLSTPEADAGGLSIPDHHGLHGETLSLKYFVYYILFYM